MAEIKKIKVENSEFKNKAFGERYSYVFLRALKNSPLEGMTVGDMKEIQDIVNYIESWKDLAILEMSKSDIDIIIAKTRAIKWVVFDDEIIQMDNYLASL